MNENEIGKRVLGCALTVHRALGPGLLENVYETCLAHELTKAGLDFDRQLSPPVTYDGLVMEMAYRLDLLVLKRVVLEIKALETVAPVHKAQLLSYLKLGGVPPGLSAELQRCPDEGRNLPHRERYLTPRTLRSSAPPR